MGLPRSNLVKPKSPGTASPAPSPPVFVAPVFAAPVFAAPVFAAPEAAVAPPVAADTTETPVVLPSEVSSERESFRTKADSVEIEMGTPDAAAAQATPAHVPPRGPFASAPSANELLERAAALGPMRMTWESIVLPTDPILDQKNQPRVAERRARLTRIVKVTLGACLGLCVIALFVSAVSAVSGGSDSSSKSTASASIGKTVPSKGIVPIERLGGTKHAKARRVAPVVAPTTAAIARPKRR